MWRAHTHKGVRNDWYSNPGSPSGNLGLRPWCVLNRTQRITWCHVTRDQHWKPLHTTNKEVNPPNKCLATSIKRNLFHSLSSVVTTVTSCEIFAPYCNLFTVGDTNKSCYQYYTIVCSVLVKDKTDETNIDLSRNNEASYKTIAPKW